MQEYDGGRDRDSEGCLDNIDSKSDTEILNHYLSTMIQFQINIFVKFVDRLHNDFRRHNQFNVARWRYTVGRLHNVPIFSSIHLFK